MSGGAAPAISVEELARRRHDGEPFTILDVRESWERAICQLPGSLSMPLATLPGRVGQLPREGALIVLCHHGVRSAHAVEWLRANGFANAVNLDGGIDAWAQRVDPAMGTY